MCLFVSLFLISLIHFVVVVLYLSNSCFFSVLENDHHHIKDLDVPLILLSLWLLCLCESVIFAFLFFAHMLLFVYSSYIERGYRGTSTSIISFVCYSCDHCPQNKYELFFGISLIQSKYHTLLTVCDAKWLQNFIFIYMLWII